MKVLRLERVAYILAEGRNTMFTFPFSTIRNEDYLSLKIMFALNDNASFRILMGK